MKTSLLIILLLCMYIWNYGQGVYGAAGLGFSRPIGAPSDAGFHVNAGIGTRFWHMAVEGEMAAHTQDALTTYIGGELWAVWGEYNMKWMVGSGYLYGRYKADGNAKWHTSQNYTIPVSFRIVFPSGDGDHQVCVEAKWMQHLPCVSILFIIGQNKL